MKILWREAENSLKGTGICVKPKSGSNVLNHTWTLESIPLCNWFLFTSKTAPYNRHSVLALGRCLTFGARILELAAEELVS